MHSTSTNTARSFVQAAWPVREKPIILPFLFATASIQRRPFTPAHAVTRQSPIRIVQVGEKSDADTDAPRRRSRIANIPLDRPDSDYVMRRIQPNQNVTSPGTHKRPKIKRVQLKNDEPKPAVSVPASDESLDIPFETLSESQFYEQDPLAPGVNFQPSTGPDTTMTDSELNAFARLFQSLEQPRRQSEEDDGVFGPSLANDFADLEDAADFDPELESILNREMRNEESSIKRYPEALRGMAVTARLQVARSKLSQQQEVEQSELQAQADEEIKRVWDVLTGATTDTAVWKVLEQQVFRQYRQLNLDTPPLLNLQGNKPGATKEDVPNPEGKAKLALFARTYPRHLLNVARILCKRTAYTPLVNSILPACKSLGISSYVLGTSTALYNEILDWTWRVANDLRGMLTLLQEMDDAALTLDDRTWAVLETATLYHYRARRGDFGEGLRMVEGMSERMQLGKQLQEWKVYIRKKNEEEALQRTRGESVTEDVEEE